MRLLKYDLFQDIISRHNYYAEYSRTDGSSVAVTWESTNHYFTNQAEAPDDVVISGGKTGTTEDAGACLALLKDMYGNPYISVILHAGTKDTLYPEMIGLLSLIGATDWRNSTNRRKFRCCNFVKIFYNYLRI